MIDGPYSGLRVLDLGQGIAAPYCAMLLAMQGAEIVKLEPPSGDWSRGLGTRYGDHTAMSVQYNRGKKSLALDLKSAAGREIAVALALRADILVEGFRPGVAARLGLGWEALSARNSRLIYVSVSGFGQDGPYADLPCTDSVAQAFSGLVSVNLGNDGTPHRVGAIIVDTLTGLYAAQAVGVALYARERHGPDGASRSAWRNRRRRSSATGLPSMCSKAVPAAAQRADRRVSDRRWRLDHGRADPRGSSLRALVGALGRPDLAADPRFASFAARAEHAPAVAEIVRDRFTADTTAGWLGKLRAADILADRVNGFDDWLADPHIVATGGAVALSAAGHGAVPGAAHAWCRRPRPTRR